MRMTTRMIFAIGSRARKKRPTKIDRSDASWSARTPSALQEQLIQKDIPLLRSVIPNEFTAVLVKGRGNYLSRRRLKTAQDAPSVCSAPMRK